MSRIRIALRGAAESVEFGRVTDHRVAAGNMVGLNG
jgi:hypothetical protein